MVELCEADRLLKLLDLAGHQGVEVGNLGGEYHGLGMDRFHFDSAYEWHFAVDGLCDVLILTRTTSVEVISRSWEAIIVAAGGVVGR